MWVWEENSVYRTHSLQRGYIFDYKTFLKLLSNHNWEGNCHFSSLFRLNRLIYSLRDQFRTGGIWVNLVGK